MATDIEAQLRAARWDSWLVVAGVTLATMALLSGIVIRGSKVIQLQRQTLEARVAELSTLLAQNQMLKDRVQKASQRTTSLNERYLRRIGADLHDGPAQHVAFAALRIDSDALTSPSAPPRKRQKEIDAIRASLAEAMSEIRNICNGLVLPHIEAAALPGIIDLVTTAHEQRTGSRVSRPRDIPSFDLSSPQKICAFRFLQEALNNAHRHAGDKEVAIDVATQNGSIAISVSDKGSGFDPESRRPEGPGAGRSQGTSRIHRRSVFPANVRPWNTGNAFAARRSGGGCMTSAIRIAIVDDHPLFREGVSRSLAETGEFEICGEGASADDAYKLALEANPDVLLLDISMPGGGLSAVERIREALPNQKLVLLTVSEANQDVSAALNAGASGYVLKGVGSKALAEILRVIAAGETYVSPTLAAKLLASLREAGEPSNPVSHLTQREMQILQFVSNGMTNKEVARKLNLQEKTVKHHMTHILAKLKVRNRTEAAMLLREAAPGK